MGSRVSISFKETAINVINIAGRTRLGRVQRGEINGNLPNTPVKELGSDKLVGHIFDIPDVTATVNSMDVGARTAFQLAGVDWASASSGTYVELGDIKYVCLEQPYKSAGTSSDIVRTLYVPGAKLERFSLNYTAGGDSTEEYSFNGVSKRTLRYDVALASGVTSASGTLPFSTPARVLKDGRFFLSVFANGLGYVPNESVSASDSAGITFNTTDVPAGTYVVVAYHADLSDQWAYTDTFSNISPDYTPPPDQPVGVRGWGVEIYLIQSGQSNQRIYRGQTCTVQGQYPNTKIQELGNEEFVGYMDDIPDITGTLEILQHDFSLQELLSGDTTGDNWTPIELGDGDWGLLIKMFRKGANRSNAPEKSVWVPRLDITQEQNQSQVGADARQTFNFSSRDNRVFVFKGDKPTNFWG